MLARRHSQARSLGGYVPDANDYNPGLVECFKTMTCLKYLHIYGVESLFDQKSFVQFPPSLKYLDFGSISNAYKILSWVAKGCKDLKGLRLSGSTFSPLQTISQMKSVEVLFDQKPFVHFPPSLKYLSFDLINNADRILSWVAKGCKNLKGLRYSGCTLSNSILQTICQMKSLTYLFLPLPIAHDIGYVFEALTELQALEINTLDETIITGMTKYCKKLEHLSIRNCLDHGSEIQGNILRLASLPKLCSLTIEARYSKEQTTELIKRLVAIGNLEHIYMYTSEDPLEAEVLFEMLRQCKKIQSIALNFGQINPDFYSKICQVVDEIDERDSQHRESPEMTHPMVEMRYYGEMNGTIRPHKWFRLTENITVLDAFEKWEYGCLSAGKP
ncbi:hypothetical protein DdX_15560 [Ditylenchus destructor]|uniref:Uncharacterized protein n=1 Tax=Ditylenchus destructor TaxID=166010 RepID=A0AAD4MSI5_9BILA|nr:hypothetical protein DdX_15560 [Ditylenchus destructor]